METAFTSAVNQFATNPVVNGRALRELLNADPDGFFRSAVPLLKHLREEPGSTYVLVLLLSHGMLISDLLRDELFAPDELIAIARQLSKVDPHFGVKLLKSILPDSPEALPAEPGAVNTRLRLMDIVQSVSDGQRMLPMMMRLLRDPDARVRSKAALLVGRSTHNARWVEEALNEGDSRVRANAVESLWDVDSEGIRGLLWNALSDPDNRVLGNALLGLYRVGDAAVIEHIFLMAQDPRDLHRSTAAWVMGRTGDLRFQPTLVILIRDSAQVRSNAFRALCSINQAKARLARAPVVHLSGWRNPSSADHDEIQIGVSLEQDLETPQPTKSPQVSGLSATEFAIYRDAALVVNYEVTEMTRTEPLALGFLLPRSASGDLVHDTYVQALRSAALRRCKSDQWLIAKYSSEAVVRLRPHLAWSGNGPLSLRSDDQPAPPPPTPAPEVSLLSDPCQIDEALSASLFAPLQASLKAMTRAAQTAKSPQFVILLPSQATALEPEFLAEANRAAFTLKASFHAIALNNSIPASIQELCQGTGGVVLPTTPSQLPQLIADFSSRLTSSYSIRFPSAPGSLKIQVFSERGCGTLMLD